MALLRRVYASLVVSSATACLGIACGGTVVTSALEKGNPDAGATAEAGTSFIPPKKDAGSTTVTPVNKCTTPRPPDPLGPEPKPLDFFVSHPPPQLQHQGGPTLPNPKIVPIFFPGDPLAADLETFVSTVGCTDYWRSAVAEYGIGDAVVGTAVHVAEAAPKNITDSQIEAWLAQQIASKTVEAPAEGSIYILFYPQGTVIDEGGARSCESFGGFHTNITLPNGSSVAYAAIPRCGGFQGLSALDAATGAASHELIEAASDPYNKETPAYAYVDDAHLAFVFLLGGENADLCAQEPDAFFKPQGFDYTVQRNWSNRAAKTGNPCVPSSGQPFFTAVPKLVDNVNLMGVTTRGLTVPAGSSKTIDVDLYGDSPNATIDLDVMDASQVTGGAGGSSYSLDQQAGKNGDTLHLTVTSPAGVTDTELFFIMARSATRTRVAWVGAVGH